MIAYIKHRKGLDMGLKFVVSVAIIAELFLGCASNIVQVDCIDNQCVASIILNRNIYQDSNITKFHRRS